MLLVGWSGLWSSVVEVSSVPEFDATEGLTKKWGRTSQDKDRVGVACSSPHGGRDWGRCLYSIINARLSQNFARLELAGQAHFSFFPRRPKADSLGMFGSELLKF